jgi:hypothetical protein
MSSAQSFFISVQSFLKSKGFNPGPIDGILGSLTKAAWNAFLDSQEAATIDSGASETPIEGFIANGSSALIRGKFSITVSQLEAISVGAFAPYAKYAQAIVEDSQKYEINPLFVLADLVNQGVNPAYNNPWGISTDNYPHGPNGSQLGLANVHVKNGPRKFGDDEWRIAFDRQFSIVATGRAYASASTIKEWALIDAPPGAENDVHGTNADEGAEVGGLYNKLVKSL